MNKRPPKSLLRFFRWFCLPDYVEEIEGDLTEKFVKNPSKWRFALEVLKLLRPSLIRPLGGFQKLNYYGMFKHNLLITYRGFKRHKTVFTINFVGLMASLICILLMAIWVEDELKKDQYHQNPEQIFQVYSRFLSPESVNVWKGVSGLLEPQVESQVPEAEIASVSTDSHEYTLSTQNDGFKVKGKFADEDYLKILNFPLWKGQASGLNDPSNILLTRSLAKRMFGREDVLGELVTWHFYDKQKDFRVAGILEDLPSTSSESFEFILPWTYYHDELISFKGWGNYYGRVLIKLNHAQQKAAAEKKINQIFQVNVSDDQTALFLVNYPNLYLHGNFEDGIQKGGRIAYVHLTLLVGVFILMIACINFINLTTAFSSLKTKEIGVKKSFGASRGQLAFQFFLEALLLATAALVVALFVVAGVLEPFNQLTGKELSLHFNGPLLLFLCSTIPIIGILAGLYPAIYLSGILPLKALKSKPWKSGQKGALARETLVFVQFSLSIMLIIGTLVVSKQVDYALNKNLGYERDNLLYFPREGKLTTDDRAFIGALESIPGVLKVSKSSFTIGPGMQNRTMGLDWPGKEEQEQISFWENRGDANSLDILGLQLLQGRNFSDAFSSESNSIIFNETAIQKMGLEDPVGKKVSHYSGEKTIIGVVNDFTTESLHNPVEPAMFFFQPEQARHILVKIAKGQELQVLESMEAAYEKINPNYPFEPRFLDQDYQAMYESEMQVSHFSKLFACLSILISSMGLFGLTFFKVKQRIKEIGIKKVLGCSSWKLTLGMTYRFCKAVLLALLVAIPFSAFFAEKWLKNYADSIAIEGWTLATAGLMAILIAIITVGTQTWKAANMNPVNSLRDD